MKKFFSDKYSVLALLCALGILVATLTSSGTFEFFHLSGIFSYDKPIHAAMFGIQAWLLIKAGTNNGRGNFMSIVLSSCIISILYGVVTEILQGIFIWLGRGYDIDDMIADAFGCAIVYFWFWLKRKQFAQ